MEKKEFNLRGNIVTIDHNFTFKETGIKLSVCNTNDWFIVCRKEDLKPAEESFSYKRKQELQKEIDNLENTKKQKIKETQDEAIKKLEKEVNNGQENR